MIRDWSEAKFGGVGEGAAAGEGKVGFEGYFIKKPQTLRKFQTLSQTFDNLPYAPHEGVGSGSACMNQLHNNQIYSADYLDKIYSRNYLTYHAHNSKNHML